MNTLKTLTAVPFDASPDTDLVSLALAGNDPECAGLVATVDDGSVAGVLLYGTIDGAAGVVRVHALAGATSGMLTALLTHLCETGAVSGARMFICELSGIPEHELASRALVAQGFTREAGIADYFADGLTLDILVLRR